MMSDQAFFATEALSVLTGDTSTRNTLRFWQRGWICPTPTLPTSWLWSDAAIPFVGRPTVWADVSQLHDGYVGIVRTARTNSRRGFQPLIAYVCAAPRTEHSDALRDADHQVKIWSDINASIRTLAPTTIPWLDRD